jgi:hypothetical protein
MVGSSAKAGFRVFTSMIRTLVVLCLMLWYVLQ